MKKELSLYHLIVSTFFIGVLLTCSLFYFINTGIGRESAVATQCYDGSVITGEGFAADFSRSVYQNAATQEHVREYQYRLLGIVSDPDVLAGDEDFLFEVRDEETDYDFLQDYLGEQSFTEEECARILEVLQKRKESYKERGAEYLLVVLPNAQTVYSENMPEYLGPMRETRLDHLGRYLHENGFTDFVDLSDELIAYKDQGLLYNNTENSLNSLGLYCVYRCVCETFQPTIMDKTRVIPREELSFYYHLTAGKAVAKRAGLADVVSNRTVSLSNDTKLNYHSKFLSGRASQTVLLPFGETAPGAVETPRLLLQFSDTWERFQAEPFFSNTFSAVTYQTDLVDDETVFEEAAPAVVIQFLYEDQLSWLLPK